MEDDKKEKVNIDKREDAIKAFFGRSDSYLQKRFGIEIRSHIINSLIGDISYSAILDIGCGDGSLSLPFAKNGNILTLIDLSDRMLDLAKLNTPKNFIGSYTFLNSNFLEFVPNQLFDIVMCIGVLAHVPSISDAIDKIFDFLKPGGQCLVQFTDHSKLNSKINSAYYSLSAFIHGNPYKYSLQKITYDGLLEIVKKRKFELINQCRYSLLFPGMGHLPDNFLFRYQLFTLRTSWISHYGSEVIILLKK
jgi:ubiquinone/menaquinone biosynthesis C-methylase UbiE